MDAHSRKELPGGEPANKRAKYEDGICHKEFKNNGVRKIQVIGCIPKIQESYENLKLMLEELDLTGVDATLYADIKLLLTRVLLRNLLFREKMRRTDNPSDLFI